MLNLSLGIDQGHPSPILGAIATLGINPVIGTCPQGLESVPRKIEIPRRTRQSFGASHSERGHYLVPTLRVGMRSSTLCVVRGAGGRGAAKRAFPRGPWERDP